MHRNTERLSVAYVAQGALHGSSHLCILVQRKLKKPKGQLPQSSAALFPPPPQPLRCLPLWGVVGSRKSRPRQPQKEGGEAGKAKAREFEGGEKDSSCNRRAGEPLGSGQHRLAPLPCSHEPRSVGQVEMTSRDTKCPGGDVLLPHPAALTSLTRHNSRPRYAQAFPRCLSLSSPGSPRSAQPQRRGN